MDNIFIDKLGKELDKKDNWKIEESILLRRKILSEAFDMLICNLKSGSYSDFEFLEIINSISEFIKRMRCQSTIYISNAIVLNECLVSLTDAIKPYNNLAQLFLKNKDKNYKKDAELYNKILNVAYTTISLGFVDENFSSDDFELLWNSLNNGTVDWYK